MTAGGMPARAIVCDIYRLVFKPEASDETLSRLTKWGILLSCATGLASAVACYILVHQLGVRNEECATFILNLTLGGRTIELWQKYAWISIVVLGVGSVVIFGFFLRDLGGILKGGGGRKE